MRTIVKQVICLAGVFCVVALFTACKKDGTSITTQAEKEQEWSQQIYDVMKDIYYWNAALPSGFDSRKYATAEDALTYLIGIKINPATNKPIDRYSFLDKIGGVSGEIGQGISGDYGFSVRYPSDAAGTYPYVVYVYKNSPAGTASLYRGLKVLKVNSSDVALDGSSEGGAGMSSMVNALYSSSTCNFTFERADGSTFSSSLSVAGYVMNSVLLDTVYTQGAANIGYLVFNQFLDAPSMKDLRNVFGRFSSKGVTDLIVDLRYNGGGSVATCDSLSSIIAPAAASGKVMNYTLYNSTLTSFFSSKYGSDFNVTKFKKEGSLELTRVFFLVSGSTASASELLINNLKPYMQVILIGKTTYGKPCGFWAEPIGYTETQTTAKEGYDLYAISFETQNANHEGGYYTGMIVDKTVADGVTYKWGDINEDRLSEALYYIANGNFKATTKAGTVSKGFDVIRQFNGMVDYRKRFDLANNR